MVSPALASTPSPALRSSMTRSVGATSPGKSISGLVVLGSKPMMCGPFVRGARTFRRADSGRGKDVDDEHERVGSLDAGLGVTRLAIALGWRQHKEHTTPDGLAHDALVETRHELALAHGLVEQVARGV